MSYYKELYQAISETLEAMQDANCDPIFRWIDFDLGQLEEDTPPVSYPCALIGFDDLNDISDYTNGSQQGTQFVTIKLAFKKFERTHSKTTPQYREEALSHLDAVSLVHKALNNLEGECFNTLSRTGMSQDKRLDLRVYSLQYATRIFDDAGVINKYIPFAEAKNLVDAHPDFDPNAEIV
jgi:hypothetical protein